MKKLLILALFLLPTLAQAEPQRNPCFINSNGGCTAVSTANPLPVSNSANSFTNITTNTNTVVKASAGTLVGLNVNTAGATSTATIYNNTSCTGAKIGTFSTIAQTVLQLGINASTGICVTTAGGTPADITITYN